MAGKQSPAQGRNGHGGHTPYSHGSEGLGFYCVKYQQEDSVTDVCPQHSSHDQVSMVGSSLRGHSPTPTPGGVGSLWLGVAGLMTARAANTQGAAGGEQDSTEGTGPCL